MTAKKGGFAGLGNLVSDISDVTTQSEKTSKAKAPPPPASQVERNSAPQTQAQSTSQQAKPAQPLSPQIQTNNGEPSGGSGRWWFGGFALFVLFIVVITSGGNRSDQTSNSPNNSSSPSKPDMSEYEQAITALDPQVEHLLEGMLTASQSNDFLLAGNNALTLEKLAKSIAPEAKPQVKDARAQNALGLKALKEQRKEAAVQNFFSAYKANARDSEVVQNFGEALYKTGDYSAARKAFYASLALTPKKSYAWVTLGRLFARNNDASKAANSFGLAFQYAKSPRQMRQSMVSIYREDDNYNVKHAAKAFLIQSYTSAVPEFLRPALGNLADVKIPVFLPAKVSARDSEGKTMAMFAVNNEMHGIEATADSYKIPFASEPDCRAIYCGTGVLSGRKVTAADAPEEGEPVEITGGIIGKIVRDSYRNSSRFIFRIADVEYTFSLSADATDDVASANSALKLGSIPVDAFAGETKLAAVSPAPAPQAYVPPQVYTPPTQTYTAPPASRSWECTISYAVSLQTFGEGVSVELRQGSPGKSRVISVSQSSGGIVRFSSLCPGNYFLAIGNGESVSVTPVRSFETGVDYESTLTMQRGAGNVSSLRKSDL